MASKKKVAEPDEVKIENSVQETEQDQKEAVPALRVHIVKKGDTLRTIAREYLGDSTRVAEIREINQLATDILTVGRELTIPDR